MKKNIKMFQKDKMKKISKCFNVLKVMESHTKGVRKSQGAHFSVKKITVRTLFLKKKHGE